MEHTVLSSENRRFTERLRALRHLPPNTLLPQVMAKEDKDLFEVLLRLPEDTDVFSWLQVHSSRNITKIALRILTVQICNLYKDIVIASSRVSIDDYYRHMLGGFLEQPEDILTFSRLDALENESDSENLLRYLLQQMQSLYKKVPNLSAFQARNERDQILADLLRLSENVDPIDWLKRKHEIFAIKLVLSHLLGRFSVIHGSLTTLPTVDVIKIGKVFRPLPAIRVRIEKIIFKTLGFLVQASIDISPSRLSLSEEPPPSLFVWQGFERVVDNIGYHYLTWPEEIHSGNRSFHKYQEQLTMAFYPSVAENSTKLTFLSQPMILETSAFSRKGHLLQLSEFAGGDLIWPLSLDNMSKAVRET